MKEVAHYVMIKKKKNIFIWSKTNIYKNTCNRANQSSSECNYRKKYMEQL